MKPQSKYRGRTVQSPAFVLAHLSDPHLADWSLDSPWSLANKRLSGYVSWRLNGSRVHLPRVLDLMVADIKAQCPDHIAITGDLVNISLPCEFENAARWLNGLGAPDKVTVVPGNHDAYVSLPQSDGIGRWHDYMSDLAWDRLDGAAPVDAFPFVRRIGQLALVGVSTAVPMPPLVTGGRLGSAQLAALRGALIRLKKSGACRVVLIHHPPFAHRRRGLLDAREFRDIVREVGAEMILHGHTHVAGLGWIGKTPVISVPSASAGQSSHQDAAAYNLYRISRAGRAWRLAVQVRELSSDEGRFVPSKGFELMVPAPTKTQRAPVLRAARSAALE